MKENKTVVAEIDNIIRKNRWFDVHFFNYNLKTLIIAGSTDLSYYHKLEVIFEDVFFVSCFFQGWHSNTEAPVFIIPEGEIAVQLNLHFEIEAGYQLFIFKTEDYNQDVVIVAQKISYNTDTVFYYNRPDLKENERIADFIKANS
jgi:hypothetical protein